MPGVQLRSGSQFGLVFRGGTLLAIPPGTATIQVTSNLRRADCAHLPSIAQIFYTGPTMDLRKINRDKLHVNF